MNRKVWLEAELAYLRQHYPDDSTVEIAKALGRPIEKVYATAHRYGLKKSQAYLDSPMASRLRRGDEVGKAFRFKPGQEPPNKGLRRPGWGPGRMRETQFKKGVRAGAAQRLWKPIGTIQLNADGYMRIKVADEPESIAGKGASSTNWEFIHRRTWEATHGPIPKGHRLWWKDGDHLNNALENLELLSDKEHMARTTIHRLPPELKDVIRLAAKLGRRIRMKEKDNAAKQAGRPAESSIRNDRTVKGRRGTHGG